MLTLPLTHRSCFVNGCSVLCAIFDCVAGYTRLENAVLLVRHHHCSSVLLGLPSSEAGTLFCPQSLLLLVIRRRLSPLRSYAAEKACVAVVLERRMGDSLPGRIPPRIVLLSRTNG